MMRSKIIGLMEDLKLRGMAGVLDEHLERAVAEGLPVEQVLWQLLCEEMRDRQERSLEARLKRARLPWDWTLETFPFQRQPGVNASQIRTLAGLDFIHKAHNLVFIGPPGTGKSGLTIGLTRKAALEGLRARFYNAQDLTDELYASLADRTTSRLLKQLAAYDVLAIDELGYLSLKPEQANAFFKLMEMRYNRKATIITTNLPYEEWYQLFKRKALVDALLDRVRHQCITITIDGPSLRSPIDAKPKPKTRKRTKPVKEES